MAEKPEAPEPQPVDEGATSAHPTEPAEGARHPGADAQPTRPPHLEEPVEGPTKPRP